MYGNLMHGWRKGRGSRGPARAAQAGAAVVTRGAKQQVLDILFVAERYLYACKATVLRLIPF